MAAGLRLRLISADRDLGGARVFDRILVSVVLASVCSGVAFAARFVDNGGRWPKSWPDEMEPLRDRAKTYDFSAGLEERSYVIPFDDREEFERLWPAMLKVTTPGAPIRIVSAPRTYWDTETPVVAGVEIFQGRSSVSITTPHEGRPQRFKLEAPWPKRFFQDDGTLFSHAVFDFENKRWIPLTPETKPSVGFRIRTDIVLIVDEDVIDLDRIEMPEDSAVIDQRVPTPSDAEAGANPPDAPKQ